ncbi:MAG: glycosyltransferase family 4 protein, partial [Candidatus Moranbacteria bacterium]|nr:glycosyltransferase family 4 protein [Candidatus Moranbacteria bacterium]
DPEENGLTRYINGLYGALLKNHPKIQVDIVTFDTLRTKKYFERKKNWNIYRIDCLPILGRTYALPTKKGKKQLQEIFRKNSYDLINTHTRFFLTSYYGIKLGKKYHIPVIHTEHGSDFVKHQSKAIELIAKIYDHALGRHTLRNARLVCGVSQSACRFAKKLGARKTEVVYNGIDKKFWQVGSGQWVVGRNDKKIIFTFIGRLIPEKGVQDLIEVLYIIENARLPDGQGKLKMEKSWTLLVVGDGHYRQNLENLTKKYGLGDKIKFLGAKSQQEIRKILQKTDLFINPSIASEGLPTTILEAAACGTRVLSSDKGGSVEVLDQGNLYPAGNLDALKEKIQNYKKIPVPAVEKFDWENIADKYRKIIFELIK